MMDMLKGGTCMHGAQVAVGWAQVEQVIESADTLDIMP